MWTADAVHELEPPLAPPSDDGFDAFWAQYPQRKGRRRGRAEAQVAWTRLTLAQRERAMVGVVQLAASDEYPKDAQRFLRKSTAGAFPFDDFQDPPDAPDDGLTDEMRRLSY